MKNKTIKLKLTEGEQQYLLEMIESSLNFYKVVGCRGDETKATALNKIYKEITGKNHKNLI